MTCRQALLPVPQSAGKPSCIIRMHHVHFVGRRKGGYAGPANGRDRPEVLDDEPPTIEGDSEPKDDDA